MKIKVLWIDDQYKDQLDFISYAEQLGILIDPFDSHEEGIKALENEDNLFIYHAVILDARVKYKKDDKTIGLTGLKASRDRLMEINSNFYLPFFIFTGDHNCKTSQDFRDSYGEYYVKGDDTARLLNDIKEAVLKKDEYIIMRDYSKTFEVCKKEYIGEEARKPLLQILKSLNDPNKEFSDELYFTEIRKILEYMFRAANRYGILHYKCLENGKVNLAESSFFMAGLPTKYLGVQSSVSHFNKIIAENVKSLIFITGAASHTVDPEIKTNINLIEYRKTIRTPYLLYSMTFQLMDVLVWFKSYIDDHHEKETNKQYWISIANNGWIKGKIINITEKGWGQFQPNNGDEQIGIPPKMVTDNNLTEKKEIQILTEPSPDGRKKYVKEIKQ